MNSLDLLELGVNALATVGTGAIVAAFAPKPTPTAYRVYVIVRKVVDFIGANWFNAKNQ